jgi:type I restriction enzyme S subunit
MSGTDQACILNSICEFIIDCEHKTAPIQEEGYPSIRTPNIGRGRLILEGVNRVSEETYKLWTQRAIPGEGDLILAREAPVGNVAIIPKNLQVCLGQRTVLIRPDKSKIDPNYLVYLLLGDEVQGKIQSLTGGATVAHLNMVEIRKMELPTLPSLPTQQKIGTILSAYDDLIENNTRRIKILEEMAQMVYREWFVNFHFPRHEGVRLVESELGLVPEGWKVKTVEETFEISGGGTPSTKVPEYWESGTINWYSPVDLTASGTMFMEYSGNQINELGLKKSSAKIFPPYSVLMTSRATLGVISINTTDACTNQGFITCIPNEQFPLYTLYHWLKENVEMFISLGTGSTFKEITKGVFKTIQLVVPTPDVVSQFEKTTQPLALQILNLQRKNANLHRTRDLLLPKLISGEFDVSELDILIPEEMAA